MTLITNNLIILQTQIRAAEQRYRRLPGSVELLAITKQQTIEHIQQAIDGGQKKFGENYLQEALPKITALADQKLEWHFIGVIQSNKTRIIAENFQWVHSIDCINIAERLNKQRPENLPPLNICLQINIDGEPQKSGLSPEKLIETAHAVTQLSHLKLRGLMLIPKPYETFEQQREVFKKLRLLLEKLNQQKFNLNTLSMGMSQDFTAAIAEGSTLLRIGSTIFGKR